MNSSPTSPRNFNISIAPVINLAVAATDMSQSAPNAMLGALGASGGLMVPGNPNLHVPAGEPGTMERRKSFMMPSASRVMLDANPSLDEPT